MTKEQIIEQLKKDVYCRLKQSSIQGVGVFAVRDIPKGVNPFIGCYDGDWVEITKTELSSAGIDPGVMKIVMDMCVNDGDILYFPSNGIQALDLSWFINHSTNANMDEVEGGEDFIAARDIKTGEELTVDYTKYNTELGF